MNKQKCMSEICHMPYRNSCNKQLRNTRPISNVSIYIYVFRVMIKDEYFKILGYTE